MPDSGFEADLLAAADPRAQLPRVAGWLAALTIPVVALTAEPQVGQGYAYSDVVALPVAFGLVTHPDRNEIPWTRPYGVTVSTMSLPSPPV